MLRLDDFHAFENNCSFEQRSVANDDGGQCRTATKSPVSNLNDGIGDDDGGQSRTFPKSVFSNLCYGISTDAINFITL